MEEVDACKTSQRDNEEARAHFNVRRHGQGPRTCAVIGREMMEDRKGV